MTVRLPFEPDTLRAVVHARTPAASRLPAATEATWQAPAVRMPTAVAFEATRPGARGLTFHYAFCLMPG